MKAFVVTCHFVQDRQIRRNEGAQAINKSVTFIQKFLLVLSIWFFHVIHLIRLTTYDANFTILLPTAYSLPRLQYNPTLVFISATFSSFSQEGFSGEPKKPKHPRSSLQRRGRTLIHSIKAPRCCKAPPSHSLPPRSRPASMQQEPQQPPIRT